MKYWVRFVTTYALPLARLLFLLFLVAGIVVGLFGNLAQGVFLLALAAAFFMVAQLVGKVIGD